MASEEEVAPAAGVDRRLGGTGRPAATVFIVIAICLAVWFLVVLWDADEPKPDGGWIDDRIISVVGLIFAVSFAVCGFWLWRSVVKRVVVICLGLCVLAPLGVALAWGLLDLIPGALAQAVAAVVFLVMFPLTSAISVIALFVQALAVGLWHVRAEPKSTR